MYDYDRRIAKTSTPKFDLRLSSGLVPHKHLMRVFVDDDQLGLLSSVQVKVSSYNSLMEIRVGLLEGLSREAWDASSPQVQETARRTAAKLRSFPTIILSCPEYI